MNLDMDFYWDRVIFQGLMQLGFRQCCGDCQHRPANTPPTRAHHSCGYCDSAECLAVTDYLSKHLTEYLNDVKPRIVKEVEK